MRARDAQVGTHVQHDTTGRYLGQIVSVHGPALRLSGTGTELATLYEVKKCNPPED